jgi:hypothetical protein
MSTISSLLVLLLLALEEEESCEETLNLNKNKN